MIDKEDALPVTRQCELLELSRSGVYYTPVPLSAMDMELMRQIDETFAQLSPFCPRLAEYFLQLIGLKHKIIY